eukprot:gnl/TRDRNA2_/TRDRNA2_38154_c0_seq1.p1 gnl/TRDRNA2_/TRDRNA2_38154_c0~~gnl/TRDRNA2_/TRDRNA2_38154_c0_seq1.p1  ORF type:complete len:815 (-),score=176.43 gnl/TRDRNA2_/TRDRNA2_38154_c0_seq1:26-2470(-)
MAALRRADAAALAPRRIPRVASLPALQQAGGATGSTPAAGPVRSSSVVQVVRFNEPGRIHASQASFAFDGLSGATHSHNLRAEKLEARIEKSALSKDGHPLTRTLSKSSSSQTIAKSATTAIDVEEALDPKFEQELQDTLATLKEMGRNIRMESFLEDTRKKERAAERKKLEQQRQAEDEQRRLLKEKQQAQCPSQRVEDKIDQAREARDAVSKKIPMTKVEIDGGNGRESYQFVDVQRLQEKALGLNVGGGNKFQALMTQFDEEEKAKMWAEKTFGDGPRTDHIALNRCSGGERMMSRCPGKIQRVAILAGRRREERTVEAYWKKRYLEMERHQHKLSKCRSLTLPEARSSFTLSALSHEVVTSTEASQEFVVVAPVVAVKIQKRKPETKKTVEVGEEELSPKRKATTVWWGVVRSIFHVVALLHQIRAKHRAANIMRDFVGSRVVVIKGMLSAIRRRNEQVRKLQLVCRQFLHRKNRWRMQMTKLWIQVEDYYLSTHVKMDESEESKSPGGQSLETPNSRHKSISTNPSPSRAGSLQFSPAEGLLHSDGEANFGWKVMRIPPERRRFALGRWYSLKVRQHVQQQMKWEQTIALAKQQKKDVQRCVNWFGDSSGEREQQPQPIQQQAPALAERTAGASKVVPRRASKAASESSKSEKEAGGHRISDLLAFGEKDILELVALCARELRLVKPFQDHPVNRPHVEHHKTKPRGSKVHASGRKYSHKPSDDSQRSPTSNWSDHWHPRMSKQSLPMSPSKRDSEMPKKSAKVRAPNADELFRWTDALEKMEKDREEKSSSAAGLDRDDETVPVNPLH